MASGLRRGRRSSCACSHTSARLSSGGSWRQRKDEVLGDGAGRRRRGGRGRRRSCSKLSHGGVEGAREEARMDWLDLNTRKESGCCDSSRVELDREGIPMWERSGGGE